MFITPHQKIRIIVIVICYIFLFGFLRMAILNTKSSVSNVLINGILLFVWLGLSTALANSFTNTYDND